MSKLAEGYGLEYKEFDFINSLFVERGSDLVKTLRNVYQENEGIALKHLYQAMEIYAEAIYQLCCK